jgi:phosphopantetheinyl transferase
MSARLPHHEQSPAAAALLNALRRETGVAEGPSSKSHSRAVVAAALGEHRRIGIDVEYCDARRDLAGLSRYLLGADAAALSLSEFYRLWTFHEAYFKAFGAASDVTLRRAVLEAGASAGEARDVAPGVSVMHAWPVEGFALTLVAGG